MKAVIKDFYTDIFPTGEEVSELCRPGQMADTCIWLLMGPKGWECSYLHKNLSLLERWEKGQTNAKRNGCEKVKNFNPMEYKICEVIF